MNIWSLRIGVLGDMGLLNEHDPKRHFPEPYSILLTIVRAIQFSGQVGMTIQEKDYMEKWLDGTFHLSTVLLQANQF